MSDDATREAIRRGTPISAKRAALLVAELEAALAEAAQWRATNTLAAQALVLLEGQIAVTNTLAAQALVLLEGQIAVLEAALRQAGHAKSCALQYGGACDCRMQLVREKARGE